MTTGGAGNGRLSFELKNELAEMTTLAETLERFCDEHAVGPDVVNVVNLALEEIVTNIISYGYGGEGGDHRIRIDLAHDGASISARVEDDAKAFDPLQKEAPDTDAPLEERGIGGLGIHLVKTLMDEVRYSREDGRNVLFIRKSTAAQA
jgi:anti-sigma regulatory factor (Ser/Thr protein kinase)